MTETEQIVQWVVACLPSIVAVITTFVSIFKLLRDFKKLKLDVKDANAMTELRAQLRQIAKENYELKKKLNEYLTKIDHVRRDDNGSIGTDQEV